jgi:hypothetical protein
MTEQQLFEVPVPKMTSTYKPIPHRDIIENTEFELASQGFEIDNKSYRVSKAGEQVIAYWRLKGTIGDSVMSPMIAFKNSYDKSMALGYGVGNQVIVCSNGMVHGDMGTYKRKHVGSIRIELKENILRCLDNMFDVYNESVILSNRLKERDLDKRTTAELLGRLYIEKNIISPTELNIIKRELDEPTYEDFLDSNAWSLYNHCTFALKQAHPATSFKKHAEVTEFFKTEVLV